MDELLASRLATPAPDAATTATAAGAYEGVLSELRPAAPELEALIGHLQVRHAPPPASRNPAAAPPPSPSAAYRSKAHPRAHTHTIYGLLAGAGSFPR